MLRSSAARSRPAWSTLRPSRSMSLSSRSAEPLLGTDEGGRLRLVGPHVVLLGRPQRRLEPVERGGDRALLLRPRQAEGMERRAALAGPPRPRSVEVLD